MVFFNIAYSLEFIVIGLGAFLLSWSWYKEACKNYYRDERVATAPGFEAGKNPVHRNNHRHCGTGLGKSLGTLLIILGIANFGATIYDNVKFKRHINNMNNNMQEKWKVLGQNNTLQPNNVVSDSAIPQTPATPGSANSTNTENNSTSGNYTPSDNAVNTNNSGSLPTNPNTNNGTPMTNPNNNNVSPGAPGTPGSQPVPGQPQYQNPTYPQQNNPNSTYSPNQNQP